MSNYVPLKFITVFLKMKKKNSVFFYRCFMFELLFCGHYLPFADRDQFIEEREFIP